jgi:hypothetical protein
MEAERSSNGIPLLPAVINDLKSLGEKYSLELI